MNVTIVMLSVDEGARLRHSLPAATAQRPPARVIVVDNACSDDSAEFAERHGATALRLPARRSYCGAMNAGIAAALAGDDVDAVLLLNADCVLDDGFLAAACEALGEPAVGSVAPRLMRAAGLQPAERLARIDTAAMTIDRRRKNGLVGHDAPAGAYERRAEAFGGDGAAVLYRAATLTDCAVGDEYLDEDFELWAADADLAWRARRRGWRCVFEPRARAWHVRFYSPSTRAQLGDHHRRLQFRNRYLMIAKNDTLAGLLVDLPWILAYELLALGHALLRERELLGGYRDAVRLLGAARRRRRAAPPARARVPFGLEPPA